MRPKATRAVIGILAFLLLGGMAYLLLRGPNFFKNRLWEIIATDATPVAFGNAGMLYFGQPIRNIREKRDCYELIGFDLASKQTRWAFGRERTIARIMSNIAVSQHDSLFFDFCERDSTYHFCSLNGEGKLLWQQPYASEIALLDGDTVFFGYSALHACDRVSGAMCWSFTPPFRKNEIIEARVIKNIVYLSVSGTVPNQADIAVIYALDKTTGKILWEFAFDPSKNSSYNTWGGIHITVDSSSDAVIAMIRSHWVVFDAGTGHIRWQRAEGASIAVDASANAIIAASENHLTSFDGRTGHIRWQTAGRFSYPLVASGGVIYVGCESGVRAYTAADGKEKWRAQLDRAPEGMTAPIRGVLYAGGVYYVGSDSKGGGKTSDVVGLDEQTGKIVRAIPFPESPAYLGFIHLYYGSVIPLLDPKGNLYARSYERVLYSVPDRPE